MILEPVPPGSRVSERKIFDKIYIPLGGYENGGAALPHDKELTNHMKSEIILLQVV